ncbi:MAG: hypothetical protein M3R25_14370 [Bacteroidota bacterium]|nr:hypothetical protein [Bacteroidota bacterium]
MKLESWVEEKSNGEYIVADRLLELNPLTLIKGKKTAILGMKNDTNVQVRVTWYKDAPDLGLDMDSIRVNMLLAQQDMEFSKSIASQFENADVGKISIGVIKPAIYFLPFGEPDPVSRQKMLDQIFAFLEKNEKTDYANIWIEWMEDSIYGKEFRDVIPNGYWYRVDSYHDRHKIVSLDFEYSDTIDRDAVSKGWEVNTLADRAGQYQKAAYDAAIAWAAKNLSQPYHVEGNHYMSFHPEEGDPMAVKYSYPIYDTPPPEGGVEPENKGYVTVLYQVDQKKVIRVVKDDDQ